MPEQTHKTSRPRPINYGPILSAMPRPAAVIDTSGHDAVFLGFSAAFLAELGLKASAVRGRRLSEVFPPQAYLVISDAVARCGKLRKPARASITYEGRAIALKRDVVASSIREGAARRILLTIEPARRGDSFTSERRTLLERLGPLNVGMVYLYNIQERRSRYVQKELLDLLGVPAAGLDFEITRAMIHPDDVGVFMGHLADMATLNDDAVSQVTMRLRGPDGRWIPLRCRARVFSRDASGAVRKVIGTATDVSEQYALSEALEASAKALAAAESVERRRVGRELHDSTVQHLVAMDLSLTALERRVNLHRDGSAALHDTRNALSAAQREIRTFAFLLHPPELDERGLADAVRTFAQGFARRTGLDITVDVEGKTRPMSFDLELALFRIAQEALMNVHRHARAHSARVRLCYERARVSLEIEDDGAALADTPMRVESSPVIPVGVGVGVNGMRARMAQLDGELRLEAGSVGLRLVASAPVRAAGQRQTAGFIVGGALKPGPIHGVG